MDFYFYMVSMVGVGHLNNLDDMSPITKTYFVMKIMEKYREIKEK